MQQMKEVSSLKTQLEMLNEQMKDAKNKLA